MLRRFALLAALPASLFFACGDDGDDSATGGEAGENGAAGDTGTGGTGGTGGSGGSGGCPATGKGSVVVEITGLPSGVDADVTIEGPDGTELVGENVTLDDLGGGRYTVRAERVADDDPIVRTVYDPSVLTSTFCVMNEMTTTVGVSYDAVPTSNKLWTTNANGDHALAAFDSASLAESGEPDAKVTVDADVGVDVAFDFAGNLWTMAGTLASPHLMRFSYGTLGSSGEKEPDRSINIMDIPCLPALRAMSFDLDGNLWVSTCGDQIVRLTNADISLDGDVSPEVLLSVTENGDLAFDGDGNLWVVTGATISRYDASRLGASDGEAADLVLTVTNPDDTNSLGPANLAFDASGNLWVTDFGRNLVFEVAQSDLGGTGERTVAAAVRISIGVTALLERPVFDESGGLWLGLGGGGVARLSPEQLGVSTETGELVDPEVVITSAGLGSVGKIAFYPAAEGLPLFHKF